MARVRSSIFKFLAILLGLRSVLFRTSDHHIEPVTEVEVSEVTAADLWSASRDEAMVVEHLVDLGRRSAIERTAHFILEMGARLKLVGMGDKTGYDCPLSQFLLADALGLSAVHVNRVLRELREAGLMTFQKGRVTFDDFAGLVALADFDTAYLDQDGPLLA